MIRAIRPNAMAQDDAAMVSGWNVAPNVEYVLRLLPSSVSCGVFLYANDATTLIASGAALVGTEQPCILIPQAGQAVEMVDADLGWHLLLTTTGTESQRTIRLGPAVDLPDEIHPVYGEDDLALVRATAAIDAAAHYIDDITVTCPLGLGAVLGDVVSVPVDGAAIVGQVESITWTATPDGAMEQAVIRRHVAIAPDIVADAPAGPTVNDDTAETDALTITGGNVLLNDDDNLVVVAVNGLSVNVGASVTGSAGGVFVVTSDGSWIFNPNGEFESLYGAATIETSVTYHASDGEVESMAKLTVTVSAPPAGAIEIVASATAAFGAASALLNLPPGIQSGDLVIVALNAGEYSSLNVPLGFTTAGYSVLPKVVTPTGRKSHLLVGWKVMGETPDSTVGITSHASATGIAAIYVVRNVDSVTPMDITGVTASAAGGAGPDAPSITPNSVGALVVAIGAWCDRYVYTLTAYPVDYEGGITGNSGSYNCVGIAACSKKWTAGAEDPAVFTKSGYYFGGWTAATLALRPA